ncbi:hypothetical protein [Sphingomonas sp. URHD0057]|uniref:hypothetical protein n=1 Tax=Sphingomonas sp. URHD0057 TaxID=1380389 RepID=UPI0018CBF640|nr:hypothetical protein [Sphingomonas sp. URHD0057]
MVFIFGLAPYAFHDFASALLHTASSRQMLDQVRRKSSKFAIRAIQQLCPIIAAEYAGMVGGERPANFGKAVVRELTGDPNDRVPLGPGFSIPATITDHGDMLPVSLRHSEDELANDQGRRRNSSKRLSAFVAVDGWPHQHQSLDAG